MGRGLLSFFLKIFFCFSLLLGVVIQEGYGQTLSPGDLAIVTVNANDNSEGNKTFDFVPLVDLEKDTEIKFTDAPYVELDSELDDGEGTITYTAPDDISAGTVITYTGNDEGGFLETDAGFNPATTGDNIIVFQGDRSAPTFLYGIGWARGTSWEYNGDTNTSDVPPNLSESDNTILNLGTTDNYQYDENSGLEGTASALLSLIGDENNWLEDDEEAFSAFGSNFTLADPPTIAFSSRAEVVSEGDGIIDLTVELVESNGTAVDVDVAFLSGSSTATNGDDFDSYSTQTVSFSDTDGDNTTKTVSIDLTDDNEFESSEKAVFELQSISEGTIIGPETLTLTIEDDDAPSIVINEIHADPDSDNGDADRNGEIDSGDDEFVEFINKTSSDIDISGWTFSDEQNLRHTFPEGTVISAGGALVLFGDYDIPPEGNFGGALIQSTNDSPTLSLNNGGDKIELADKNSNTIVEVNYPDADNGQSIVRDPEITGDFKDHSDVEDSGGDFFSPGTKVDGTAFGSKYAVGIRGSEGWRMVSSPTKNTSFEDLLGNLWMQGVQGSDDQSGDLTLASWSEEDTTFTVPSDMNDDMTAGKGYIVYTFEDDELNTPGIQGGFPKVINTDKDENPETVDVTVSATDADGENGIDGNEGWNLLGNPFGTDISVSALISELENDFPNVNTNVHVWDHDANNGNGEYLTLSGGDRIAPFQAFFVKFDAEVSEQTFQFDRSVLEANTGTEFYKDNNEDFFSFDLELHGEQYFDTYTLQFDERGDVELDRYDSYKLFSLNSNSINLFSTNGNNRLQKNVLPGELESSLEIPLGFQANGRSSLTFKWSVPDNLPSDWDLTLIDTQEDREINLLTSQEYQFSVSSENEKSGAEKQTLLNKSKGDEEESRFVLAVDPNNKSMDSGEIPQSVKLNPNYPNPFNPTTTIPYELAEDAEVKLTVWNMIGQKVATLVDGMVDAGSHEETWNASNMPSGIYIARFEVGSEVFTRKMTLIK